MKCVCRGAVVCLECRAEIAWRVAGNEGHGWTWTVYGIKAMWAALDAKKRAAQDDDGFGWSPR